MRVHALAGKKKPKAAKKETFSLDIPKPKLRPLPAVSEKPIALQKPEELSPTPEEKKKIPHVANALLWSATITFAAAAFFLLFMGLTLPLTLGIAIPMFTGFSILFYNMLEEKG
jgi:hypothetical protein